MKSQRALRIMPGLRVKMNSKTIVMGSRTVTVVGVGNVGGQG